MAGLCGLAEGDRASSREHRIQSEETTVVIDA
jgi:hypothetical protein